ncbi:VacJ family lipoprotein [Novosphingobium nitrogenifigens DSM 19370]|uniref:VacJ family lipoprotein n=1 Tax=Novosphingobium nitrogenifigens DSM 19370 TaxID=983920 RepID=F1ZAI4_9SPHN|nr:VacJ family lipoprotein [Novosphingobium nitrogenifigens]EGD58409.1 VacJ family lipoprotein [Novosphingobium nitrogenifigens DSM 19370]
MLRSAALLALAIPVLPVVAHAEPVTASLATESASETPASATDAPAAETTDQSETTDNIVVRAHERSPGDPLEGANRKSYAAVQAVDRAVVGPVAKGYEHVLPRPIRRGIHNVLYNLREPVVFVNYLLQHKFGKAGETLARFTLNSTAGVGGLVDVAVAKPFRLPHRVNGFANTLGFYGVGAGPYMFLPIIGPTTVRDLIGTVGDRMFLPVAVGWPFTRPAYGVPVAVLGTIDDRIEMDDRLHRLRDLSANPYAATRERYLCQRRADIAALHRHGPTPFPAPDPSCMPPVTQPQPTTEPTHP